jgi:hypothetical protein
MHERDRETEFARDEVDDPEAEGDDQAVRCFVPAALLPLDVAVVYRHPAPSSRRERRRVGSVRRRSTPVGRESASTLRATALAVVLPRSRWLRVLNGMRSRWSRAVCSRVPYLDSPSVGVESVISSLRLMGALRVAG